MKKTKLLVAGILFTLSSLAITPAHASQTQTTQDSSLFSGLSDWLNDLFGKGGSGGSGSGSGSGAGGGTSLPINANAWLLVVAGAAVGCKVIISNSKKVQPQKA